MHYGCYTAPSPDPQLRLQTYCSEQGYDCCQADFCNRNGLVGPGAPPTEQNSGISVLPQYVTAWQRFARSAQGQVVGYLWFPELMDANHTGGWNCSYVDQGVGTSMNAFMIVT